MARRNAAIEVNRQVRGIITEASPLTFPENASVDERNFVLNRDGSRQRRLGMDLEENHELIPVDSYEGFRDTAYSTHKWGNLGDRLSVQLVVVQSGRKLCFFDLAEAPLSANKIFEYEIATAPPDKKMSFAVVDDQLVVAAGTKDIHVFTYKDGTVEVETGRLKIRDLFGVHDLFPASGEDQIDLRQGNNVGFRPEVELSDEHLYNLRNQTWATMSRIYDDEVIDDPIFWFNQETGFTKFPSNADNLLTAYAPMADDTEDRVGNRFHPLASVKEHTGSFPAPRGYFIIDALERGKSRMEELQAWYERQNGTGAGGANPVRYRVGSLPQDRSAGGASVAASYAGRVFYAGFEGVVSDGDRHSPKMESMVMFSQLDRDPDNLLKCHQEGDPTSNEESDLLDTDGGFIPLNGARDIKHMVEFDRYLLVFADNGVWSIAGGGDYGFTATDYRVDKVTSFGCAGADTVVVAGDMLLYWSHDGIYVLGGDQTGRLTSQNISEQTIQTLFEQTNSTQRDLCKGEYETARARIRWLLYDRDGDLNITRSYEVIYDKVLQAFTINEVTTEVELTVSGDAENYNLDEGITDQNNILITADTPFDGHLSGPGAGDGGAIEGLTSASGWSEDGTKLFQTMSGDHSDESFTYVRTNYLDTPFVPDSMSSFVDTDYSSIAFRDSDGSAIRITDWDFNDNRDIVSFVSAQTDKVFEVTLAGPDDLENPLSSNETTLPSSAPYDYGDLAGFCWKSDGTGFFVLAYSFATPSFEKLVNEYSVTTPWMPSSGITFVKQALVPYDLNHNVEGLFLSNDESQLFYSRHNNPTNETYLEVVLMSTPGDLDTMSSSFDYQFSIESGATTGYYTMDIGSNGTSLLLTRPIPAGEEPEWRMSSRLFDVVSDGAEEIKSGFVGSVDLFEGPIRQRSVTSSNVTVGGVDVTVDSEVVTVGTVTTTSVDRKMYYLTTVQTEGSDEYSFSQFSDPTFYDWKSLTGGEGVDTPAYIITGYAPGEDFQRNKQVTYLTFHFLRTEDGFTEEFEPTNQSSFKVRVVWDWANSPVSGKWGRQFQAYRYKRHYLPVDSNDDYDTGDLVISTKNKIRGHGKVFSIHGETEPGKDCKLQGWSLVMGVAGNV